MNDKPKVSLARLKKQKLRYGPAPVSLIIFSLHLKDLNFNFICYYCMNAVGVVPDDGSKTSPCTSSIEQIIFSFWSFEISGDILRNQKSLSV